jgi:DNA mismatch endonuclease (patch repair protein)
MSRVRAKDTVPELRVRKAAHMLGLRFRLHRRDLPGKPDLVFPRRHLALFVHGCFWHRHHNCPKASLPGTRQDYWTNKFDRNVARDSLVTSQLRQLGWRVVIVWECETRDFMGLKDVMRQRLISVANERADRISGVSSPGYCD